ncbi:protein P21-like [Fagus crenata]
MFTLHKAVTSLRTKTSIEFGMAAAVPGGGRQLNPQESWPLDVNAGTTGGRVWARTGCNFDGSGRGNCQTGDCGGLLQCQAYGVPPNTLAEFGLNQFQNLDFFDMSLVDGFNVPMDFSPMSNGCTRGIRCTVDIIGQCPNELKAPGGCNNPCTVFKTDEYCCNSGSCGPTTFSKFFKDRCQDAYSYPKDDATSTFTCPGGTNYKTAADGAVHVSREGSKDGLNVSEENIGSSKDEEHAPKVGFRNDDSDTETLATRTRRVKQRAQKKVHPLNVDTSTKLSSQTEENSTSKSRQPKESLKQ